LDEQVYRKVNPDNPTYQIEANLSLGIVLDDFEKISVDLRVKINNINTVVEKWPTQLKLQLGQEGAEE
jgi:hypothetical protein